MNKDDEKVLVVRRKDVFRKKTWQGINEEASDRILSLVLSKGIFLRRGDVEKNASYKQIIPYIIFKYRNKYLLLQRKKTHDEGRLANLYSFGIGGHIRKEDLKKGESVFDWSNRELNEEVVYKGKLKLTILGILNNDSAPVHEVHLGIVILAQGDTSSISVRDEHKSSRLVTLDKAMRYRKGMELWSRIVLDYLKKVT